MRSRSAWLTACSCAVAVAVGGCGGSKRAAPQPKLVRDLARRLEADAADVATKWDAGDCPGAAAAAARLRDDVLAAVNERRVPSALEEPLTSRAQDLASRIKCAAPPPPPPPPSEGDGHDHGKGKHKGKGKGHGHGGEGE
jgi:hypothetical protein